MEAACLLGYAFAATNGGFVDAGACPPTIAETEEFFGRACYEIDQRFNQPAECRWFLNWYDETPRDEMRRELLPEIELAIALRKAS